MFLLCFGGGGQGEAKLVNYQALLLWVKQERDVGWGILPVCAGVEGASGWPALGKLQRKENGEKPTLWCILLGC